MVIQKQSKSKGIKETDKDENCPIKEAIKKGKERLSKMGVNVDDIEKETKKKKKSETKSKKTYKVILKVAIVLGVFFLASLIYNIIFYPNVIDAVLVIFRDLFPSFDDSAGMEHFVN
jgi:hypothetical protein